MFLLKPIFHQRRFRIKVYSPHFSRDQHGQAIAKVDGGQETKESSFFKKLSNFSALKPTQIITFNTECLYQHTNTGKQRAISCIAMIIKIICKAFKITVD